MIFHGYIRNGMAVPDSPITIPDGTRVRVELMERDAQFYRDNTIEMLAHEQGISTPELPQPIDWPQEDSIDEFLQLLREVRRKWNPQS